MSRARDTANLGAQAGSGLTASDITTGTLGNTVQDNITRVGTVGTGTWEGTTVAVAQGGTGVTSKTGTGNVVLSSSPTLETPALGTPASGVATNLTGIPAANLTGTITSGTQDAITRLGTVTSANLSNTAIVYPAGHVVQVVGDAVDIQSTTVTTAWDFATAIVQVITPKLDNSSMIISAYFLSYNLAASTNYFDLYRNSSTLTETYNLSTDDRGMAAQEHHTTGSSEWQGLSLLWLDNSSEMTGRGDKNAITYKLTCKTSNGNRAYINNSSRAKLVVMEIAV